MIYLDNAATSFQKPPEVAAAVLEAMETMSSPGRGSYETAMRAADTVFACRCALGTLFHLEDPSRVVFTMNATHALNLAIKSLVPPGGRVVISGYEHNAVTRPLTALGAEVRVAAAPLFQPAETVRAFERALEPAAHAVICSHVSNVFGFIQPVDAIAELCRRRRVPLIVDASQSAGILPLDMEALGAAFIAFPGHKGLYGPQGTGVLLCGDTPLQTLIEGGTGSNSRLQSMPEFLPDRMEAGTQNVPGIAGLLAGVRYVQKRGLGNILTRERQLTAVLAEGLREIPGLRVLAQPGLPHQAGVLSVVPEGRDGTELGEALAEQGLALRTGYHCAPLAHHTAGTLKTGTVRLSVSDFTTGEDICRCLDLFHAAMP